MMAPEMRAMGRHQKQWVGQRDIERVQKGGERDAPGKDHSKTIPLMLFQADQVSGKNTYQRGSGRSGRVKVKLPFRQPGTEVRVAGGGIGGGGGGGGEGVCYKTNMRLKRQRLVLKVIHSLSKVAFQDISFVRHAEHSLQYKPVLSCDSPFSSLVRPSDIQSHCHHNP